MRVAEAWAALIEAMETHQPACIGLELFTADDLTKADVEACAAVCRPCPLLIECERYARLARPSAGVWAGRKRTARTAKGETE